MTGKELGMTTARLFRNSSGRLVSEPGFSRAADRQPESGFSPLWGLAAPDGRGHTFVPPGAEARFFIR